jgi:hypothetical protein
MTNAELAIRNAVLEVEAVGADPRLTDAVMKLTAAQEAVADFVDAVDAPERPLMRLADQLRTRSRDRARARDDRRRSRVPHALHHGGPV